MENSFPMLAGVSPSGGAYWDFGAELTRHMSGLNYQRALAFQISTEIQAVAFAVALYSAASLQLGPDGPTRALRRARLGASSGAVLPAQTSPRTP